MSAEFKEFFKQDMPEATLCFLLDGENVLLAMKKRGFGINKYNGVGGKQATGEAIEETAKREAFEEIGVTVGELEHIATLIYIHPHKPEWNQKVTAFIAKEWEGEPVESEEMAPKWFPVEQIPFSQMWSDDQYWLPIALGGKSVEAVFSFDENGVVIEQQVKTL